MLMVLGADGYLGWPTAMYFSELGYDVVLIDSYLKRNLMKQSGIKSLFDTPRLEERVTYWNCRAKKSMFFEVCDMNSKQDLDKVFKKYQPNIIIHYAEIPSAPFSMQDYKSARLTLSNNLISTLNLIYAVKEFVPDAHIVKLGTMGEYGTPNIDIEEGYLEINHKGRKDKFLFPRQASSLYHTTKIQDTDLLSFYVRTWGLRVTDLMQGPVYGLFTDEMQEDENLFTQFNYDEIFGTVLNRFLVQAVIGHPLTVYGSGDQKRGYLNIKDTMKCIRLAVENPADPSKLIIRNQYTETFTVMELARSVQKAANDLDLNCKIQNTENPRVEKESHYYNPSNKGFMSLGLEPEKLSQEMLMDFLKAIMKKRDAIQTDKIVTHTNWK